MMNNPIRLTPQLLSKAIVRQFPQLQQHQIRCYSAATPTKVTTSAFSVPHLPTRSPLPISHYQPQSAYRPTAPLRAAPAPDAPKKHQQLFQVSDETGFKIHRHKDFANPTPTSEERLRDFTVFALVVFVFSDIFYFNNIFSPNWFRWKPVDEAAETEKLRAELAVIKPRVEARQEKFYSDPNSSFYLISYDKKERWMALDEWKKKFDIKSYIKAAQEEQAEQKATQAAAEKEAAEAAQKTL